MDQGKSLLASVLIVAGDEVFLKIVHSFLERSEFRLLAAADGEEALSIARAEAPSVVVIDDALPGVDAPEVCRVLKAVGGSDGGARVLVICEEVVGREEERVQAVMDRAYASGADAVLLRPLERSLFVRTLAEMTEARPRRYFRLPAYLPATFRRSGQRSEITAGVRELSEGGAFVMTREIQPPGTNITLTLQLPPNQKVTCWAQVVTGPLSHVGSSPDLSDPGMGVRFLGLGEGERNSVKEYVDRFLASAGLLRVAREPSTPEETVALPAPLVPYLNFAATPETCLNALRGGGGGGMPPGTGRYPAEPYPWEVEAARAAADGDRAVLPVAEAAALRLVLEGYRRALLQVGLVREHWLPRCIGMARELLGRVQPALQALRTVSASGVGCARPGEVALTRTRLYRASIALRQVTAELDTLEDASREPWTYAECLRWAGRLKEALVHPPSELQATIAELSPGEIDTLKAWNGDKPPDDGTVFPLAARIGLLGLRAWVDAYIHTMSVPMPADRRAAFMDVASRMLAVAEAGFRLLTLRATEAVAAGRAGPDTLDPLDETRLATARPLFALRDIYDLYRTTDDREVFTPFDTADSFHAACRAVERDGRLPVNAWALAGERAMGEALDLAPSEA